MQFLPHYKPQAEFFLPNEIMDDIAYFALGGKIGLTVFTKPIVASTVLSVLTSNRSRCGGEEKILLIFNDTLAEQYKM